MRGWTGSVQLTENQLASGCRVPAPRDQCVEGTFVPCPPVRGIIRGHQRGSRGPLGQGCRKVVTVVTGLQATFEFGSHFWLGQRLSQPPWVSVAGPAAATSAAPATVTSEDDSCNQITISVSKHLQPNCARRHPPCVQPE